MLLFCVDQFSYTIISSFVRTESPGMDHTVHVIYIDVYSNFDVLKDVFFRSYANTVCFLLN